MSGLTERAVGVLEEPLPERKAALVRSMAAEWADGRIATLGNSRPPQRPQRPAAPELRRPAEVPKRKITRGTAGRTALLHALAHIELNAIDLACDILARFASDALPRAFCDDWLRVAAEEAKHFLLLSERLRALGSHYGALAAHDGLWEAAEETSHDLLARLAVVPLVLEARGLDVTPAMIAKLRAVEDEESAAILEIVYREEIGHVAIGKRWFDHVCADRRLDPRATWQALVRTHFRGRLKPPFNDGARQEAGFPADFYAALANS